MRNVLHTATGKELIIACGILLFSCLFYFYVYSLHDQALVTSAKAVWFQGDMPSMIQHMTDRHAVGQYQSILHPLLSLQTFPPIYVLKKLGVSDYQAVQMLTATIAGLWSLTLYALLRVFGCIRLDALMLLMLAWSSAATVFWLATPEPYALSSISLMIALMLAIIAGKNKVNNWILVTVSAFSLSVTATNWMVGILATFTTQTKQRAWRVTFAALCLVTLLWFMQTPFFAVADIFIGHSGETSNLDFPYIEKTVSVIANLFSHSIIAPEILTQPSQHLFGEAGFNWTNVSIQHSKMGSATMQGNIATVIWGLLFVLGVWACIQSTWATPFKVTLLLTLVGQVALHTLYGEETFLYSLHFVPLLIGVVAFSLMHPCRPYAIMLIVMLIPLSMINNWQQFLQANELATSPRGNVLRQSALRPHDAWTKFDSHAILAIPGSMEKDKSYIEPGGSFSPKVGSFGVSVWLTDPLHTLIATSDTINPSQIEQSFVWQTNQSLPSIQTQTPFYHSITRLQSDNTWQHELDFSKPSIATNASLMIRSVGPSGGPIYKLSWNNQQLVVNDAWQVTFDSAPLSVHLGQEGINAWFAEGSNNKTIETPNGWGFANIKLNAMHPVKVNVKALHAQTAYQLPTTNIRGDLILQLPDERFNASLQAQIAHLMMSLVKNQTRPGDPTNYPIGWQRDGAYILVALARAGELEKAKMLSKAFADEDFFGGFGAEADSPGLALWALNQVASQLKEPAHDQWLWPHVQRKAQWIEQMLTTKQNMYAPFKGRVVPQHINDPEKNLVAEPAKNGLIVGRMDHHRPLLFVNAVNYLGLIEAADLATRLGKHEVATHWNMLADQLKSAWVKSFKPPYSDNERTYISGLWPTWIASDLMTAFKVNLNQRWKNQHDEMHLYKAKPLWTYFDVAETHQWLYLAQPERVWSTLEWFWQHQSIPGLYTWWEGEGEENSFGIWQNVRGWVKPNNINPHYWTAAEMALLQMDMLGHLSKKEAKTTLIIGAGIPLNWLNKPLAVKNLRVGPHTLDWHWENNVMQVTIDSPQPAIIKLGEHFPTNAKLLITYRQPSSAIVVSK
jgi:hypothetical protein